MFNRFWDRTLICLLLNLRRTIVFIIILFSNEIMFYIICRANTSSNILHDGIPGRQLNAHFKQGEPTLSHCFCLPYENGPTLNGKTMHHYRRGILLAKSNRKSQKLSTITKTCLYNFDTLKPHFYIVKLGFTGVYISFLISAQKHRLWVLVRTASSRRF